MAETYSINELITQHQQVLQLSWLIPACMDELYVTPSMWYWVGEYSPDNHHAIEVIHRDNLQVFTRALQQNTLYLPPVIATALPCLVIFSENIICDSDTLVRLQKLAIGVLHSPSSSKSIIRTLAFTLAEYGSHQTQHGVMLSICGEGVLLRGKSGLGKSAVALELVSRGHSLVADDAPLMHRVDGSRLVFAVCPPLVADMLEVRAMGIVNPCKIFGPQCTTALMPVNLVIELVGTFTVEAEQRLHPFSHCTNILGVDIPYLQIPVSHTANLALIVETIIKNHVLYKEGYDASAILIERQKRLLTKQLV